MYQIQEVDGEQHADEIHLFNSYAPKIFPSLATHHLTDGFWFFAYHDTIPVAFAGMVLMGNRPPFDNIGLLKRCYVAPDHHGHSLQLKLMMSRELRARQLRLAHLVSDTHVDNHHSASNHRAHGFETFEPDQPWAKDSIFWVKTL